MAELNYERRGPAASPGPSTLVLIHGIGSRWQMWEPVLDRLAAECDVVALDLPGFGFSPPLPPGTESTPGALAEAVGAFLGGLGVSRPHLAGNSLGGWVALEMARRDQARSVTALSPAGFASRGEGVLSRASLRLSYGVARWIRADAARLSRHVWFRNMAYGQMVHRPSHVSSYDVAESIRALADSPGFTNTLAATTGARFRLGRPLEVPVTIAWGEHDRLLLPRQAQRAAAEIPNARIVPLPGCGHIPTYDDPELVARVVLEGRSPN